MCNSSSSSISITSNIIDISGGVRGGCDSGIPLYTTVMVFYYYSSVVV